MAPVRYRLDDVIAWLEGHTPRVAPRQMPITSSPRNGRPESIQNRRCSATLIDDDRRSKEKKEPESGQLPGDPLLIDCSTSHLLHIERILFCQTPLHTLCPQASRSGVFVNYSDKTFPPNTASFPRATQSAGEYFQIHSSFLEILESGGGKGTMNGTERSRRSRLRSIKYIRSLWEGPVAGVVTPDCEQKGQDHF